MFLSSLIPLRTGKIFCPAKYGITYIKESPSVLRHDIFSGGQAIIEYMLVTIVLVIAAGAAVRLLGNAMSKYFGFLVAFIALPIP